MSGLTIGLMGMDLTSLQLLKKAGTPEERKYAAKIIPVVEKHHLVRYLSTLFFHSPLPKPFFIFF